MTIKPIAINDSIKALLVSENLPVTDLDGDTQQDFWGLYQDQDNQLVGLIGLEHHGEFGLVRSLLVRPEQRKLGIGQQLVSRLEADARAQAITTLYLLTTTAASFFARLGYDIISRSEAPEAITQTTQFAGLCPSSATLMRKRLIDSKE